jgi:thioredoxin reductase
MTDRRYDAVIIGGGVAGLSAALWLARYRRGVRVFDSAEPRNEPAWAVHGYPGLVDPTPTELRRRLYEQAVGAGADHEMRRVERVHGGVDAFEAELEGGSMVSARRIVLAYGLVDHLPDVAGIAEFYGTSVYHCPDCDGPGLENCHVGVIGWDRDAANLALYLQTWSPRVTLLAHGHDLGLDADGRATLADAAIAIRPERLARAAGTAGHLTHLETAAGETIEVDKLFFHLGTTPRSDIGRRLACALDDDGYLAVDRGQQTSVPGVHAAGDITGHPHLAICAAAEGVRAALSIHRSLLADRRV